MSDIKSRVKDAMKTAMRNRDKPLLAAIRLIQAEFKRVEVDERIELDDTRVLAILDKMAKQRKDSINQFEQAGRTDLAEKEQAELKVLQQFLPAPLTDAEIDNHITDAIAATSASGMQDMGKVMAQLKPLMQGRADMGEVSKKIRSKLQG